MRVAMYYSNRDIRIEELPRPTIGPGELLVKIHSSGICGSDVMEWYRAGKTPLVLGHEVAGEVVEAGDGITEFTVGERVVATHHVPCFRCHQCLSGHETVCDLLLSGTRFDPGGFCEYVRLAPVNVERGTWKIPDSMTYDAATFVEPLACVLRGQQTARVRAGSSVLVLGSGISGLLHVHLASVLGAGFIAATDLNEYRLDAAKRFGASTVYRADQDVPTLFRQDNKGQGADVVIVCASAEAAYQQAMSAVARGGVIMFFAPTMAGETLSIPVNDLFWRRDLTITTSYAGSPADCAAALELIANGRIRVEEMITHRFGLAETVNGSALVAEGKESIKVIIRPQE
ncbi:MAG: alcohol dehydrogenase catalytic domain-containing protein [Proteobacteria bacterium]|nr:zinc-binding dehydrogenase [Desulfobulbaceae bacterium]MBU4151887.1 alcohol dehydrogenase catalytic domain-containing protein [Pseudomonadota bacterium]